MYFKEFKELVNSRARELVNMDVLYKVKVEDKNTLSKLYIENIRNEITFITNGVHDCQTCKNFIKKFGGVVALNMYGERETLWDIDDNLIPDKYKDSVRALREYTKKAPILNRFFSHDSFIGKHENNRLLESETVTFEHFCIAVYGTAHHVASTNKNIAKTRISYTQTKEILKSVSVETLNKLIDNDFYKKPTYVWMITRLKSVKDLLSSHNDDTIKDAIIWYWSQIDNGVTGHIKNSSMGKLMLNLERGDTWEKAIAAYTKRENPANKNITNRQATKQQVETVGQYFKDEGYLDSLKRRYMDSSELHPDQMLHTNEKYTIDLGEDPFKDLSDTIPENSTKVHKQVTKTMAIEDFIKEYGNNCKMEVLFENSLTGNLATMLTEVVPGSKKMFYYDSPAQLMYSGGLEDTMMDRVKKRGGDIDAPLVGTIAWYNIDDLDIHIIKPDGEEIYYNNPKGLDVDANRGTPLITDPVENIAFPTVELGKYIFRTRNFKKRANQDVGYRARIKIFDKVYNFTQSRGLAHKEFDTWATLEVFKDGDGNTCHRIDGHIEMVKGDVNSAKVKKWEMTINTFQPVSNVLLSPNYWVDNDEQGRGNKHFMFVLENAKVDEVLPCMVTQHLKRELKEQGRLRVLNDLVSKSSIKPDASEQISGIAFSETIEKDFICKVTNANKTELIKVTVAK